MVLSARDEAGDEAEKRSAVMFVMNAVCAVVLSGAMLVPVSAYAELRAFRLKITNTATGAERFVVTRFDHVQYPMYNFVARTETLEIAQTWMCYNRSDYVGVLCPNPADPGAGGAGGAAPGVMNSGASNPLN